MAGDWDACSRPRSRLIVSYLEGLFFLVVLAGGAREGSSDACTTERFIDMDVLIVLLSEKWIEDEDYIE